MAQIDPWSIKYDTECYAAVREGGYGFICGRIHNWKLYDLKNPNLRRTLSQQPGRVIAAFETREELEQWLADLYKEPEQETSQQATPDLNYISKGDPDKGSPPMVLSSIL